ncbi:MAG: AAA family ATPase [Thermoplasmata archaeon]
MFVQAQQVRRHFKVALTGRWKTGKTRGALSFPKPAVIDTHRGTDLYDQKYDFKVLHAQKWAEMEKPILWLQKNAAKEGIETVVFDDASTIYEDLIGEVSLWRTNKSGSMAPLNQGDWGVIKRRWKMFLQMLLRLDLNVVLVIREKDEYEDAKDDQGRDTRKKTGESIPDIDRQTLYLFDFQLRCYTEENKKKAISNHFIRVEGTRHEKLPKYYVHDITGKLLYPLLFEPIKAAVEQGAPVPQEPSATEGLEEPNSTVENVREIQEKFGYPVIDEKSQPEATAEDLKVLFTRANEMTWPDDDHKCRRQFCTAKGHRHADFTGEDGKRLIKGHYNVESTKELRKPQLDFLYGEFGKVLAGVAYLDRDEKEIPYVATPSGVNTEEVRAKVEAEFGVK